MLLLLRLSLLKPSIHKLFDIVKINELDDTWVFILWMTCGYLYCG